MSFTHEFEMSPLDKLIRTEKVHAFPHYWQVPAATEKAAFDSISSIEDFDSFEYIGFPWATLIDGLRSDTAIGMELLIALKEIGKSPVRAGERRVTVAQHIHAARFISLFKACGITDIFWSHALHGQTEVSGITMHPFPLFPAQTPETRPTLAIRPRKYLANFIGAYNPKVYLTEVRQTIFDDINVQSDLLIVKREAWHFDRAVYDEQIGGRKSDASRLEVEDRHAREYISAIENSWFTLCPSGSGPNSIRTFESLCLGSIPMVLTRSLRLPGPRDLWEKAAIIEDDTVEGYRRAIALARATTLDQREKMLEYGAELCALLSPDQYSTIMINAYANDRSW